MVGPAPTPATLHSAADVATALRCSEWWVKEQARHRRIPYCWIGGSYRFTDAHLAEIVRIFERRPVQEATPVDQPEPATRHTPTAQGGQPAVLLHARPPRRARRAGMPDTTAA